MKKYQFFSVVLAAVLISVLSVGCSNDEKASGTPEKTGLSADEISNEAFKKLFPLQYASYQENSEMTDTTYAGSTDTSKFVDEKEPLLPILFNGYGFATEYNEDRGHSYALEDITTVQRINEKSTGACLTCKSTAVPQMIESMGDDFYSGNFKTEIYPKAEEMGHSPIGCSDCHDPETMDLRVTRPSFIEGMAAQGVDVTKANQNDMRSYVCGQCHSEYYFAPENSEVTFPWDNGFKAADMYEYYQTTAKESGFEKDWVQNVSGTPVVKAQHPDFETFMEGTHGEAGVSCADCHMPYEKAEDGKKFSSHHWQSPLKTMETSCGQCHPDDLEERKNRVEEIQTTYKTALDEAEDISATAHYYVNKMITSGCDPAKIAEAQEHVRKGQWFWDYCAAENSTGFHDPQGSMENLLISSNESNAAIQIATEELVKKGVNIDELNAEIEKAKKAVGDEETQDVKKTHATNAYFPPQQPPAK